MDGVRCRTTNDQPVHSAGHPQFDPLLELPKMKFNQTILSSAAFVGLSLTASTVFAQAEEAAANDDDKMLNLDTTEEPTADKGDENFQLLSGLTAQSSLEQQNGNLLDI